jgi:hypothetical protein
MNRDPLTASILAFNEHVQRPRTVALVQDHSPLTVAAP